MSHEIWDNNLAYRGDTPWHGLGVRVPDGTSGAEMLTLAGLDWQVQPRALRLVNSPGDATGGIAPMTRFRAITRSDNNRVFSVTTDRYKPVQNAQIVEFFRAFCEAGKAQMETVGGLRGGATVWALARLNGDTTTTLEGGDTVTGYMLLATSHDGSMATIGRPTQVRVVCANTLGAAMRGRSEAHYALRHTRAFGVEEQEQARRVMGMGIEAIAQLNEQAAALAKVHISRDEWFGFAATVLGGHDRVQDKDGKLTRTAIALEDATITSPGASLPSARGTLWGAVNGVTYWADHARRAQSQDSRLSSAWFGQSASLKQRALAVALQMAGVAA